MKDYSKKARNLFGSALRMGSGMAGAAQTARAQAAAVLSLAKDVRRIADRLEADREQVKVDAREKVPGTVVDYHWVEGAGQQGVLQITVEIPSDTADRPLPVEVWIEER